MHQKNNYLTSEHLHELVMLLSVSLDLSLVLPLNVSSHISRFQMWQTATLAPRQRNTELIVTKIDKTSVQGMDYKRSIGFFEVVEPSINEEKDHF